MPAPALSDFDSPDGALLLSAEPFDRAKRHGVPTGEAPWPSVAALPMGNAVAALPAPGASLFTLPYKATALMQPPPAPSHHAEQAVPGAQETGGEAKPAAPGPVKASSADRTAADRTAKLDHKTAGARTRVGHGGHRTRHAAHGARRSVRIASLKKR